MQSPQRFVAAALVSAALLGGSSVAASASQLSPFDGANHAVFVQTNDPAGNQVQAYHRANNGTLSLVATYNTGGIGGKLNGAVVDPLASQGSLEYDVANQLLIGVNAGSDTVYAFHVDGDTLSRRQVLGSGGHFPVSIAKHGDLVYVLNAEGAGAVKGFDIEHGQLRDLDNSTRTLSLTAVTDATQFLNTPGQARFTPDGSMLIVTTKNNGSHIDVFNVRNDGRLSFAPVANASQTPVPFGISFDARGQLVIAEAGTSNFSTYALRANGTLSNLATLTDGQSALCWIASADGNFYGANAGSGSVTGVRIGAGGTPTVIGTTSVGGGAIDLAASRDGNFLYVELGGAHAINQLKIKADGSLVSLGTIPAPATMEGIVAI